MTRDTFAMDVAWPSLLAQLGVNATNVLRRAALPDDLLSQPNTRLDTQAYFRFWEALEAETASHATPLPLRLYAALRPEVFSPPLFAALCSPDLVTALERLAQHKALVAPQRLLLDRDATTLKATLVWHDQTQPPPPSLVVSELLFLTTLARMGTHDTIRPLAVTAPQPPTDATGAYAALLGVSIRRADACAITFRVDDALKPFLSSNEAMWRVFEPELRRRMAALDASATTAERLRAALLESLPAGSVDIATVARRLALSGRTLQRRLEEEGTSYGGVLKDTREALALHYLQRTTIPNSEIAFLLGFHEPNSFFRAFAEWTGRTPEAVRRGAVG